MIPEALAPYVERVVALEPAVLEDCWRGKAPPPEAATRAHAFAAAIGHVKRGAAAWELLAADRDDGAQAHEAAAVLRAAVKSGVAALRVARRRGLVPDLEGVRSELAAIEADARRLAARGGMSEPEGPHLGEPVAVAERLDLLWRADDALSVACALAPEDAVGLEAALLRASLRVGRLLTQNLSKWTFFRLQRAVEAEQVARELFLDAAGHAMWTVVAQPDAHDALLGAISAEDGGASLVDAPVVPGAARLAAAGAEPSPWLGVPGEVQVLVWDALEGRGRSLTLQVRAGEGARRGLGPVACEALKSGFAAASALMPRRTPPAAFDAWDAHLSGKLEVDGHSLGLAAALAFYSLWTNQGLPKGTGATGRVRPSDGAVLAVDGPTLVRKFESWEAEFGNTDGLALVPVQAEAPPGATRCGSLRQAVAALDLAAPDASRYRTNLGEGARTDLLKSACAAVERQQIAASGEAENPWRALGDEIVWLVNSFDEGALDGLDVDLSRARAVAALAYVHAGETELATALLATLTAAVMPPAAALFAGAVRLSAGIDDPEVDDATLLALDAELEALIHAVGPGQVSTYAAWGTRGRLRMHRRLEGALPMLERAATLAPPRERARSRTYLAMALREAGRLEAAKAELLSAHDDLQQTARFDVSYERQCRLYVRYELGRSYAALGQHNHALPEFEGALRLASETAWWPRAGILRAMAASLRKVGRSDNADRIVQQIDALGFPAKYSAMKADLIAEARGQSRGLVY